MANQGKNKNRQNPYTRRALMQFRTDNEEQREILTKAQLYNGGNVSEYLRTAALNYRPIKKVQK